jgi:hypothetical protein
MPLRQTHSSPKKSMKWNTPANPVELELFLTSTTTTSKKEREIHQKEYLMLLHDTKEALQSDPIGSYIKGRKESIHDELEKELEEYLAEIAGD